MEAFCCSLLWWQLRRRLFPHGGRLELSCCRFCGKSKGKVAALPWCSRMSVPEGAVTGRMPSGTRHSAGLVGVLRCAQDDRPGDEGRQVFRGRGIGGTARVPPLLVSEAGLVRNL